MLLSRLDGSPRLNVLIWHNGWVPRLAVRNGIPVRLAVTKVRHVSRLAWTLQRLGLLRAHNRSAEQTCGYGKRHFRAQRRSNNATQRSERKLLEITQQVFWAFCNGRIEVQPRLSRAALLGRFELPIDRVPRPRSVPFKSHLDSHRLRQTSVQAI